MEIPSSKRVNLGWGYNTRISCLPGFVNLRDNYLVGSNWTLFYIWKYQFKNKLFNKNQIALNGIELFDKEQYFVF